MQPSLFATTTFILIKIKILYLVLREGETIDCTLSMCTAATAPAGPLLTSASYIMAADPTGWCLPSSRHTAPSNALSSGSRIADITGRNLNKTIPFQSVHVLETYEALRVREYERNECNNNTTPSKILGPLTKDHGGRLFTSGPGNTD